MATSDHPIYDSLSAIHRYQGGWAFEDHGMTWRPWSDAWDELCGAVRYRDDEEAFEQAKATLRALLREKAGL